MSRLGEEHRVCREAMNLVEQCVPMHVILSARGARLDSPKDNAQAQAA